MSNILISSDWLRATPSFTPSFSGGSFLAALPLANIASRELHLPARSTTDSVADAQFTIDLGTDRAVRCLAALTNISSVGAIRVRGFLGAGSTVGTPILDALDFSTGWSANGTPVRTAASYDGSGADGVPLDLVEDDDAVTNAEGYLRTVTYSADGQKVLSFRAKAGTATSCRIRILDTTAAATRMSVTITWAAGVPTAVAATGTMLSTTLIGDGVYRFVVRSASITAANTNQLGVFAASDAASSTTQVGTTYFGDFMAWNSSIDRLVHDTGRELAIPSGLTAEDTEGLNVWWSHITDEDKTARIWRVNINDTTNPDTFIDVYRMFIGGGIQNEVNASVGLELNFLDASTSEETDGGATIHDVRRVRRELVGVFEMMDEATAYGDWFAIKHRLGSHGQLLVCLDPDDADALRWKRTFLATQATLNGISHPQALWHAGHFRFLEQL